MSAPPFTEKAFYLGEFRGRTLAVACAGVEGSRRDALAGVLGELEANGTRVVLLTDSDELRAALGAPRVDADGEGLPGAVWRALRGAPRVSLTLPPGPGFAAACRERALDLGVSKWVVLDAPGAFVRADGSRISFADLAELEGWLAAPTGDVAKRIRLLREVEAALRAGLAAVNVCSADGLGDELFSYAGSGTLFTRERYVSVRPLGIDDFDAAADLVRRGVAEGYLAERSPAELDRIFACGFGAFVEGRHLAGIGALLPHPEAGAGEIASLYTLTRFLGEGVGGHLVTALVGAARERDCAYVFACTTQERVAAFFERQGFARVGADAIPDEKWRDYDPVRRDRVLCLRVELQRIGAG